MENNFNEDFDNLFARDLSNAGKGARPDPEAWPALSGRLDNAGKRRRRFFLPWLLLFALAASNGWLLWQWRIQQAEINALRQSSSAPTQPSLTTERYATIIYDTVYRTVVITRRVTETTSGQEMIEKDHHRDSDQQNFSGISSNDVTALPTIIPESKNNQSISPNSTSTQNTAGNPSINPLQPNQGSDTTRTQTATSSVYSTDPAKRDTATSAIIKAVQTNDIKLPAVLLPQPDTAMAPIKPLRQPVYWRLGLSGGILGTTRVTGLSHTEPICASLRAELLFRRHWSVEAVLSYATYKYQIKGHYDERISVPPPPPPSGNVYYFRQFEGRMQHIMPSLAVHYRFRPDESWSWYVGAGYSARLTLAEKKAECEYIEHGTLAINRYEVAVNIPDRGSMGLAQLGTEYALSRRWLLFGESSAMFDIGKGQRTFPMIAGQAGVKWLLK